MLRFIDGFDGYVTADIALKWSSVAPGQGGDYPAITGGGRTGNCMSLHGAGTYGPQLYKVLDSQASWVVGFAFHVSSLPSSGYSPMLLADGAGNWQCCLILNSNGTLAFGYNGGTALATSTSAISANTWYYIEFAATISASVPAGSCKINVDGVNWVTVAAGQSTKYTGNATADRFFFNSSGSNIYYLLDDLYICDGTGSHNTAPMGDMRVETLYPSGAGTNTDFMPTGAGTNYGSVNETAQDGDTTYVASSTVSHIDTYALGNLASSPAMVAGVAVTIVAKKDDSGSRAVGAEVRSGGTNYAGAKTDTLTTSYAYYQDIWETDPATSSAWTASGVNALEAGVKLLS